MRVSLKLIEHRLTDLKALDMRRRLNLPDGDPLVFTSTPRQFGANQVEVAQLQAQLRAANLPVEKKSEEEEE